MELIEKERLRGCLEDYLRQKGLPLKKPFHCLSPNHEDRNPSMSYNAKAQNVHCFACGAIYDLFDLVGIDYSLDHFPDKLCKAAELFGFPVEPYLQVVDGGPNQARKKEKLKHLDKPLQLPDRSDELLELKSKSSNTYAYFLSRGIPEALCKQYELFQTVERAVFPVREEGRVTGWCARALRDDIQPRYKNSTGTLGLWNGDKLRQTGSGRPLYITEGIIDALILEFLGLDTVALCGSQNGGKLLRRAEAHPQTANTWRFVLLGDGDAAGRKLNAHLSEGLTALGLSATSIPLPEGADVASLHQESPDKLRELLQRGESGAGEERELYAATAAAGALDSLLHACRLRGGHSGVSTGIANLDKLLDGGLHPGFYVLGAISSLGKTSLALQIADSIAGDDQDVLFITLEQSRHELMAKSLSRISATLDQQGAFTVRELLGGSLLQSFHKRQLLEDARETYSQGAASLFLREGIADIGAAEIREMVRRHQAARGKPPIVFVDYLQILKPSDFRATDKQNVDRAVVELKRLSRDFDIPVFAISSFNRENYKAAVSMEAFKESGAVEYSADVLLGLQLQGAGEKGFDSNGAKLKSPRELELVILKNRTGIPYAKIPLYYDAKFGRFWQQGRAVSARLA